MSKEQIIAWWDTQSFPEKWCVDVLKANSEGEFAVVLKSGSPDFPIKVEEFVPLSSTFLPSFQHGLNCARFFVRMKEGLFESLRRLRRMRSFGM